ncbi:type III secretion system translocon subunit SctE [Enterobacter cloacae]|uniref:type III secretion system translocon subunit SctE n=1 Tax=Enterobacter cloacae TaxID=550 RepID=UPI002FF73A0B
MDITPRLARLMPQDNTRQGIVNSPPGLDTSNVELKRQAGLAKRFGNSEYKKHPQLDAVKGALQTLQPAQILKLLNETIGSVNESPQGTNINTGDVPELKRPVNSVLSVDKSSVAEAKYSSSARATELLSNMILLMTDTSMGKLLSKSEGIKAMMRGACNDYSEMASLLESQGKRWASDIDNLNTMKQQAGAFSQDITEAQSALNDALKKQDALNAASITPPPVSDELLEKINAARLVVAEMTANLNQVKKSYNNFLKEALDPAISAEQQSREALENTQLKAKTLVESYTSPQQNNIELRCQESDPDYISLTFLMALMSELINESANDQLQATAQLKQKLAEAAAKDSEKKAKQYEEDIRKAEDMNKTMGCIGKTLGWAMSGLGFALAIFTGGTSLAMASVGLALAIGDEIGQAVTGRSFMADAMKPLMELMKPVMDFMGKISSAALQFMGVDKEAADMVGQILGAIAAAVALIGATIVAGPLVSKGVSAIMKNTNISQKLMNSILGQTLKRLSKGIGSSLGVDELQLAKVSNYSQKATLGMNIVNTSSQAVTQVIAADKHLDAAKINADMMKNSAIQDLLSEMITRSIDSFTRLIEAVNDIMRNIAATIEKQTQNGQYITRLMRSVAG